MSGVSSGLGPFLWLDSHGHTLVEVMERVSTSGHFLGPTNEESNPISTPPNHSDEFYNPQRTRIDLSRHAEHPNQTKQVYPQ